jgi:hypothetical protein
MSLTPNVVTKVLIFPAGEINSVELHDALATSVNIKLYGASSVDRHGPYIFRNYISGMPLISDSVFINKFNQVLEDYEIDVIFPTHDTVATFLIDNQEHIKARIIGGDKETAHICRDKKKTYDLFFEDHFIPKIYKNVDEIVWPAFIKPRVGQGTVGAKKVNGLEDLKGLNLEDYVISEYLPGQEYTVDCLTDKKGELRVVSPRSRERIMAGVSVSGEIRPATKEIREMALTINKRLVFRGLWFFQIKEDDSGEFKLLEISTRAAGTMCLTRARGINLPLLSVYTVQGFDIEVLPNNYHVKMDRTLINRYQIDYDYDKVYLDFDDTLIVNERVHPYSIMFLYQCRNNGKNVYLITKHEKDIYETLKHFSIDRSLFADVISLGQDGSKISRINPERAIFIDNAFQERKYVHDKFNIPVFDVDSLEVLLDWRT